MPRPTYVLAVSMAVCLAAVPVTADAQDPSTISALDLHTQGALDERVVERIVRRRVQDLSTCFGDAPPAGEIDLSLVVDRAGRVASAALEEDRLGADLVSRCVVHDAAGWRFPEAADDTRVLVTVRSGRPAPVSGRLAPSTIREHVRHAIPEARRCYERALAARPTLEGRVEVRFVVAEDGTVIESVPRSGELGEAANACVAAAIGAVRFPASTGGAVTVHYPFVFRQP